MTTEAVSHYLPVLQRALLLACGLYFAACSPSSPPAIGTPEALRTPAADDSLGPRLTSGSGQILLSWMERQAEGGILRVAELGEQGWGPAIQVVQDPRMFVNWADMPSVLSVVKGAKDNSHWAAHWLSKSSDQPYAYDVRLSQSTDSGAAWSEPMTPHTDGTLTEHGFVAKFRSPKGTGLIWLDGRNTVDNTGNTANAVNTGMTLRYAVVGMAGELVEEQLVDDLVCDCCPTGAVVSSGGPLAVYRNRTPEEVRDIYISRFNNGQWAAGVPVANDGWVFEGCPVNGPVITASGDLVGVAWFTAAADHPRVQVSVSRDGGKSFPEPTVLAEGSVAGYVDLVFAGNSAFVASWIEKAGDEHEIRVRSLGSDGTPGLTATIARTTKSMQVPQMEYRQGELVMAWTESDGGRSSIVSARVPVQFER